ncbi:uncharacterized protein LOC114376680 [Glycine soja]|uniref:uncharacterized protein LOC114376680 n=1 Tax=Glycine soja TaxID=3848 RepID=UPI00103C6603|nr:uncharacterized protein LOC114376680 [Glycine soja]
MGKNKGHQSHSAAKQIIVKGTTSGSGKSQTSATSGLAGCLDVVQANQNAYTASQDNLVGKVLVKKARTSSAKTDDVAHQVFDNLSEYSAESESESSPEVSCTLGDNDSTTDDDSSHSCGSKSSPQLDDNKALTPWVNLFKDNRSPSKGFGMKFSPPPSDDEVLLEETDLQPLEEAWGHSLIGYVAGRFPGKKALLDCCKKWGVKFSYSAHESGWLVFKFESEDDLNQVLSAGPYFIFQRPLLLKVMPAFFDFGNEELSKIPVWVKLRNLPLELWNPQALGKILSKIGSPIRSDHLTASKGSISFARALVEVDASLELIDEVRFRLPTGKTFVQKIEYENRPSFCTHCKMIGHRLTNCKTITANKPILITACPTLDQPQVGDSAMPPHTNTAGPSDNPKNVQTNLSVPPHRKHVLVANHVPVLQNSSDLKETGNTELDDPIEEGFVQDKIHLSVLESNAQLIHCAIDCKTTAKRFQVSFIYGLHSIMARRSLWINLNSINANMNCPWLLIGDFNSILSPTDRFNGAELNAYELQDFVDCYSDLGLGSINTHGPLYMWTNGRVWRKLDRALCNQVWFNSFGNSACEVMEFISISDHTPLVVTTELVVPRGNSPFKFNNLIVDDPNFLRIVADGWKQNIHGCSMFKVYKKLKALKAPLKNLFKQEFSNISNRVELAEAEYNSVLNFIKQNPQDSSLLALANRTRGQTIMLRKAESMKFAQLIKNKYLLQADKCSKFFHALIKRNKHRRFIAAIRLEDGHNTSSQDEIAHAFVNHFRNFFSAHELTQTPSISICNRGPKVPTDCFAALLCPTSKQKVWNIISVMANNKAPGPDGFNVLFFKKAWNIVGDDIFAAVNEFFTTGKILKQLNHAIIVLIPKHDQASQVNHFRPISCCNLLYKIVSKILANRIAPVLETIIGETQTAFIKNRKMMDNIFLVQEILRKYARKRPSPRCLLKIDLHKAYDFIS